MKYVALLRAINVGGRNLIRMADLRTCLEVRKFERVSTYIQSGNILFDSDVVDAVVLTAVETPLNLGVGMRFDLLRNDFSQNKRFCKVLGAHHYAIGVRRRAGRKQRECGEDRKAGERSTEHHRGCRRLSSHPTPKSASRARIAAGMAPARMTRSSTIASPRKINSPSPPAPIAAAMVASPTEITTATRTPDKITLTANGNST